MTRPHTIILKRLPSFEVPGEDTQDRHDSGNPVNPARPVRNSGAGEADKNVVEGVRSSGNAKTAQDEESREVNAREETL